MLALYPATPSKSNVAVVPAGTFAPPMVRRPKTAVGGAVELEESQKAKLETAGPVVGVAGTGVGVAVGLAAVLPEPLRPEGVGVGVEVAVAASVGVLVGVALAVGLAVGVAVRVPVEELRSVASSMALVVGRGGAAADSVSGSFEPPRTAAVTPNATSNATTIPRTVTAP